MTKIKLSQLYTKKEFTHQENNETITFTPKQPLHPHIKIGNTEYTMPQPIHKITIIYNHILQQTELKLSNKQDKKLLHINLEESNLEDVSIEYKYQ